jgi:hypothetical protein
VGILLSILMFKSVLSFAFQAEKDYLYKEGQFLFFSAELVASFFRWASGFVLLYDVVYDMYAPVVIQAKS